MKFKGSSEALKGLQTPGEGVHGIPSLPEVPHKNEKDGGSAEGIDIPTVMVLRGICPTSLPLRYAGDAVNF